jgi:predicted TIM-barrel fold metal-dependent hydrolase
MVPGNTPPVTGWDCHAHLFGPYAQFPLAADRSYTPPEALREDYLALLQRLGLSHGVLVHPSAYGEDFSLVLDALAALPQLRGVLVARAGTLPTLKGLRDLGIRALRYSHRGGTANFAGSASFTDLLAMADDLADAGLHAELWTDGGVLPDIADRLATLPIPVVIDHMGGFDVGAGVDAPGFAALRRLLSGGNCWVKLCAYRNLFGQADPDAGQPFHAALLAANPDHLVWGSDWPHLRVDPAPDTQALLATFKRWTASEVLVDKILVDNPNQLYF